MANTANSFAALLGAGGEAAINAGGGKKKKKSKAKKQPIANEVAEVEAPATEPAPASPPSDHPMVMQFLKRVLGRPTRFTASTKKQKPADREAKQDR
eukprot:scaffold194254_cov51-Prasinocladus_malaysianus.AAC.1